MPSTEELLDRLRHSLTYHGLTAQENLIENSVDLMSRAVALNDAARTLELPYTYELTSIPPEKRNARRQLGTMSAEIVKAMRNELMHVACVQYLRSRGLTLRQVDAIFRGDDGTREISPDHSLDRFEERTSETTRKAETSGHASVSG